MPPVPLSDIDLNLLVVLDVLLEECHITRSAKRLGRTQSAISHALARLRSQLDDPLLVRVAGRMRMTPRAVEIQSHLRPLLHQLRKVLAKPDPWNPTSSTRVFSLIAPDFTCFAYPEIHQTLVAAAPRCRLELLPVDATMFRKVAMGQSDLAFFRTMETDAAVICDPLCTLKHAVFLRRGHPALADWGLDSWLAYPHVRIRVIGGESPVDQKLAPRSLKRKYGPVVTNFLMVPPILAGSDMMFAAPYGVMANIAQCFDLVAMPCPLPIDALELALFVGQRAAAEPAVTWFQALVRRVLVRTFNRQLNPMTVQKSVG